MTAWYDKAIFYHMYPLGMTGAPFANPYPVSDGAADGTNRDVSADSRMDELMQWIPYLESLHISAIYIGPLFESVGHGYETTDYKKLDSRLGTNEDLKAFVKECHEQGIRVIFDGVFNHTGRDFFAFKDLQKNREQSPYKDWYCNVNFWGNNEYNDGFSYENWGGYNLLVKLNQHNPAVRDYICDVIRFWVSEFDVDGIRLDAADVMYCEYMKDQRLNYNEVKQEFWLMCEVIHGDYSRWVNEGTLHSVTNYQLHKALYSGHNDHNYFEIAHTVKRLYEMGGNRPEGLKLYNFVDNHDVERIYTKLQNKAHFTPVHVLLYTLPGVPSVYYGSEFGIEGKKERYSDDSIRPALHLADYANAAEENLCTKLIAALGRVRQHTKELSYGDYKELMLQNRQYAFSRNLDGKSVIVMVNNDDNGAEFSVPAGGAYVGALSGRKVNADGQLRVQIDGNSGEIWIPAEEADKDLAPVELEPIKETPKVEKTSVIPEEKTVPAGAPAETAPAEAPAQEMPQESAKPAAASEEKAPVPIPDKSYEEMTVEELQQAVLQKLAKNGPVTDQMKKDVADNVYHDSLVNWVKSFR